MMKKRFSYVGLSLILAALVSTPVFSDAPSDLIEQQLRQRGGNSSSEGRGFRDRDSDTGGSSNTKSDGFRGGDDNSFTDSDSGDRGSNDGGSTNTDSERLQGGDDNSSTDSGSGDRGSNNGESGTTSSERPQGGNNSSSREDGDSKEAGSSGSGAGVGIVNPGSNTNGNNSSSSGQNNNSGGITSTPGGNNPAVDDNKSSNVLDAFVKNPFSSWFLLLILLGLLGALLWRFRKYRLVTERDLEAIIDHEVSIRLEQHVNQYVDQIFEQKLNNNIGLIVGSLINQPQFNQYIGQYVNGQIGSSLEQHLPNYTQLITHNLINNNHTLNQYIDQHLYHGVVNNSRISNEIVAFVANSSEINNKINQFNRDIDIKVENLRKEWNLTFINLLRQHVDELIGIIGSKETFNILMANAIAIRVNELVNQITTTKNELTVLINDADRHLYEWTLGELISIKGCLTDRQALVEQLAFFSAKLSNELNHNPCVDINTFKPFKLTPVSSTQLSPVQMHSLSET